MRARSILLRGMASGAVVAAALLTSTPLAAQTVDPKATASAIASQLQGQVTGNVTSQSAPNAVPGYGGADLPQGQYLSNPNSLAGDGAVAAVTSQPYAIVTNPNRPTVDPSTLGLSSAKQVESSPTSYTALRAVRRAIASQSLRAAGQLASITIPARSARPRPTAISPAPLVGPTSSPTPTSTPATTRNGISTTPTTT